MTYLIIIFLILLVVITIAACGFFCWQMTERVRQMQTRVNALKKYIPIEDVDQEVKIRTDWINAELQRTLQHVEQQKNQANANAYQVIEKAKSDAIQYKSQVEVELRDRIEKANQRERDVEAIVEAERKGALKKVRVKMKEADEKLELVEKRRGKVMADAEMYAREVAGDAMDVVKNQKLYEASLLAIQNQIDGYGDKYLIPSHTVLDELAEQWGHKEAGRELKLIRQQVRICVDQKNAGTCDYSEAKRRDAAIDFVVHSFNAEADRIISRVKSDNYGKLKQEMENACHLINLHGQPFRNARINPGYLMLRQDELKWAVAIEELKRLEREEQKAIREQQREEERERKEIEKARKESEKEEKLLKQQREKLRTEMEKAMGANRAKFEAQMAEMEAKLKEAEERGQRAISMAQQTKRGHVYIISNEGSFGENIVKVGLTRRLEPEERVKELGDASVPFAFDIHAMIHSEDAPALEAELHRDLDNKRVNKVNTRKEFFRASVKELKQLVDHKGLDVRWTMKADAREYRESKAMEEAELLQSLG